MHTPPDMSLWQGHHAPDESPIDLRWHHQVQAFSPSLSPGLTLLGFACDEGVRRNKGRPGAAFGPDMIRRAMANLSWHHHGPLYDAGNVECEYNQLNSAQQALALQVQTLLDQLHFPLILGGGHEVAYGNFLGLSRHLQKKHGLPLPSIPTIGIINFDAHFNLRSYAEYSSATTPFLQIADYCQQNSIDFHYCCLGINEASNTQAQFQRANTLNVHYRLDQEMGMTELSHTQALLSAFMAECDNLYLTIDLDVLPASIAPAVSAPTPYGVSLEVIEALIIKIKNATHQGQKKLLLADIAEYNPDLDIDGRTARVAARLAYQISR